MNAVLFSYSKEKQDQLRSVEHGVCPILEIIDTAKRVVVVMVVLATAAAVFMF